MRSTTTLLSLLMLCGAHLQAVEPIIIADFEDGSIKPFEQKEGLSVVDEHATSGSKALMVKPGAALVSDSYSGLVGDWSTRDTLKFDVFVPGDQNVKIAIQIRDPMDVPGYWAWHNRYTALAPGKNTVQFPVADTWRGEILRRDVTGMLDTTKIRRFVVIPDNAPVAIYIDNIRLDSFPVPKIDVPGLKAFDVEPVGAPGFPGYVPLTDTATYSKEKGFGWKPGAQFANSSPNVCIRLHPDNLFRDWLSVSNAELQIDVPNGRYRVYLQLEDPGAWEFMQNFRHRTVSAEGATVVDETMSCDDFLTKYFRNQDAEDLPGEDPFDKYVETRHPWKEFEVTVADGQLNLGFRSDDAYGNTLSAVLVAPVEQAAKTKQFMTFTKEMRRYDWAQSWKPVSKLPEPPVFTGAAAAENKRDGFVIYPVSPYAIGDYQGETSKDPLAAKDPTVTGLHLTAALGEAEPATFGLRPGRKLGKVEVTISALKEPGGAELGSGNVTVRVGRYRITRHGGDQSGLYDVSERELRLFNRTDADVLRCDDGMARRFWILVQVPENAKAGTYRGTVTVKAEKGGTRSIPVVVEVLPFSLPAADHDFALYGCDVLPIVYYPEQTASILRDNERMLQDLASHGITSLPGPVISPRCEWKGDHVEIVNAKELDASFAMARKYGFRDSPVGFPNGGADQAIATGKPIQGQPTATFIAEWFKVINDTAKQRGWPKPYFCFGDEPNIPDTLNQLTAIHQALHAVSPDIWTGIAYHIESEHSVTMMKTVDVHHFKDFCSLDQFKQAKAHAKYLLNCNVGFGRQPFGLREWRASAERGTDGCITYSYTGSHIDLYYDLDGRERDFSCAPPRRDGTRDTVATWECTREGVDDFRYARALAAMTRDAAAPASAKTAAQALLTQAHELGALTSGTGLPEIVAWRQAAQKALTAAVRK